MLTQELNAEHVSNLINNYICPDLEIRNEQGYSFITSDNEKFCGIVKAFPEGTVVITKEEHDKIINAAIEPDYTALYVAATPDGVFRYNLSLLRLTFENYSDIEAGVDTQVANLDISNGTQILDWFPDFASEDDYIDALMGADDGMGYSDGDEW